MAPLVSGYWSEVRMLKRRVTLSACALSHSEVRCDRCDAMRHRHDVQYMSVTHLTQCKAAAAGRGSYLRGVPVVLVSVCCVLYQTAHGPVVDGERVCLRAL